MHSFCRHRCILTFARSAVVHCGGAGERDDQVKGRAQPDLSHMHADNRPRHRHLIDLHPVTLCLITILKIPDDDTSVCSENKLNMIRTAASRCPLRPGASRGSADVPDTPAPVPAMAILESPDTQCVQRTTVPTTSKGRVRTRTFLPLFLTYTLSPCERTRAQHRGGPIASSGESRSLHLFSCNSTRSRKGRVGTRQSRLAATRSS